MKHSFKLLLATCLLLPFGIVMGQTGVSPKLAISSFDNAPSTLSRVTNFNSSVYLGDTALALVVDSLRSDGRATIFTVYESDADSIVGLWQIGSENNQALWLNSRYVSYDDFFISYRKSNEHGVIVHTMLYQYPALDSNYNGHDTLFLGSDGSTFGDKNLCAFLYYPGRLGHQYKRQIESALAIRYGAVLHGPYVNSLSDTLWNPLGDDSLFSAGICGIGRDDSLSLLQPKSIIRNGIITVESATPLSDLEHIFLGCDTGLVDLSGEIISDDTNFYNTLSRQWKLRAHTYGHSSTVRLTVGLPIPADNLRLRITTDDGTTIIAPDSTNSFTLNLTDNVNYYISLLINSSSLSAPAKSSHGKNKKGEEFTASANSMPENSDLMSKLSSLRIQLAPNPTSGHYTLRVNQSENDIINIRVVDVNGRIVEQHSTTESLTQYTYTDHISADGIYYVTVSSNGRQQTIKLIVVK